MINEKMIKKIEEDFGLELKVLNSLLVDYMVKAREFRASRHKPFGKTLDYILFIRKATLPKVTKLIKFVCMQLQKKVYPFWS